MADDATAPTPPADAAQPEQATAPAADTDGTDWKAEARKWEQRAKANSEARTELDALKAANQTDLEKLTADRDSQRMRADQLAARLTKLLKADAIRTAALAAKAIDADVVLALVADDVTIDDDGEVQGVEEALRALTSSKPHLFNDVPTGFGDGVPKEPRGATTPADAFASATKTF